MSDAPTVTLYVKEGCHLCEDALAALACLRPRYPHLVETVDIADDPALYARYWDQIPVLVADGQEQPGPLTPAIVERVLAGVSR